MPIFYVHIRDGDRLLLDGIGLEADSVADLHLILLNTARAFIRDEGHGTSPGGDERIFEAVNEDGHLVLTVPFRDAY